MRTLFFLLILLLSTPSATVAAAAGALARYPTTSGTQVAFVAYGKLWSAPLAGGAARPLTDDSGNVSTPLFAPDGRSIAFTWRRSGHQDVYVIPAEGGAPRRLTYEATGKRDSEVVASWTQDSQRVIYLSDRAANVAKLTRAFAVPIGGGMPEMLPLDRAGLLSFAPGARVIAYNRDFRNFELRKRYVGGQAQDLYTYDIDHHVLQRLTDWKGTDTFPMWTARGIYFVSDRGVGFRANIWRYDLATHAVTQITHFTNYDVDWPSLGPRAIVFQQGGRLWAIDLPSERLHPIDVAIANDGARTAPRQVAAGATARVVDAMGGCRLRPLTSRRQPAALSARRFVCGDFAGRSPEPDEYPGRR